MLEVDIDSRDLGRNLQRLAVTMRKDLPTIIRQSARRIAVNAARHTAPFGFESPEISAHGMRERIRADVNRTHQPLPVLMQTLDEEQRRQLTWLIENSTPGKVNKWLEANGLQQKFRKTADRQTHRWARRGKSGPVPKDYVVKWVVPEETNERLQKKQLAMIGYAKYGWSLVARALGGTRGIPAWIKKRRGSRLAGQMREVRTPNKPSITLTNLAPYADRAMKRDAQQAVVRQETKTLVRIIETALQRQVK